MLYLVLLSPLCLEPFDMRPAITMGSFAMNVLAWNNYIEDSLCRSQNHAPAACCVWKALNQRVSAAASKQHKLSAAYSRIFMAARHSYPQQQAKDYVESLPKQLHWGHVFCSQDRAPAACCVWKALNQRVSAGGQEPMTVCPGQRRPDSIEVKTYLQMSDFGYGQVAKP